MSEKFGIYDTADGTWLGDDSGPRLFDDEALAKIAARVLDVQMNQMPGTCVAREYDPAPKRLRESVDTKMSTLDALKALESGRVI